MVKVRRRKTQILRASQLQRGQVVDENQDHTAAEAPHLDMPRESATSGLRNHCKHPNFDVKKGQNQRDRPAAHGQGNDHQSSSCRSQRRKPSMSPQQPLSSPNFTPTKHNTFSNQESCNLQNQGKTLAFTSQSRENQVEDRSHQSAVNPFTHRDEADHNASSAKKSDCHKGKATTGSPFSPSNTNIKARAPLFTGNKYARNNNHQQQRKADNPFSAEHGKNSKK